MCNSSTKTIVQVPLIQLDQLCQKKYDLNKNLTFCVKTVNKLDWTLEIEIHYPLIEKNKDDTKSEKINVMAGLFAQVPKR